MNVIRLADFKGRLKLKEYYKDFIYCPKCSYLLHWKDSPHLAPNQLAEAISFPRYTVLGHPYYLNERAMIEFARYEGVVK